MRFPGGRGAGHQCIPAKKDHSEKGRGQLSLYYRADKERKTVWLLRIVYGRRDMDEVLKHVNS